MKRKVEYPDAIFEAIGWFTIVAGFMILGSTSGMLLASKIGSTTGIVFGSIDCLILVFIGVRVANNSHKEEGTINLFSRTMATPESDKKPFERS